MVEKVSFRLFSIFLILIIIQCNKDENHILVSDVDAESYIMDKVAKGDLESARRAVENYKFKNVELRSNLLFQINKAKIEVLMKAEKYKDALVIAKEAEKIKPNDNGIINVLSTLYYLLGEYDRSLPYMKKDYEMDPKDPRAWKNLGVVYFELFKYQEALPFLEKYVSLELEEKSDYWDINYYLLKTYYKTGNYKKCLMRIDKIRKKNTYKNLDKEFIDAVEKAYDKCKNPDLKNKG